MARIFKYTLLAEQRQLLMMPEGAELLTVKMQDQMPVLYALIPDPEADPVTRIIRFVTTGEVFSDEGLTYIDSFIADGWFVGHVFEQCNGVGCDPLEERFQHDYAELRQALDTDV